MTTASTDWLGATMGEYRLDRLIGEGAFSFVYRGVSADGTRERAVKVAKPPELQRRIDPDSDLSTWALRFVTGSVAAVHPDPVQLIATEVRRIRDAGDPALPHIEDMDTAHDPPYYVMEIVAGRTLRDLMLDGPVPIRYLAEAARNIQRLRANSAFAYHGDLKPENVIVTESGIKLLDPGFTGPLDCREGTPDPCIITTPAYYPYLTTDDLLAFGIMIWEIALRVHPLADDDGATEARLGPELRTMIRRRENIGQYFLSPLKSLRLPSELKPGISIEVEKLLRNCLRIHVTDQGEIEGSAGFANFNELIDSLESLSESGTDSL